MTLSDDARIESLRTRCLQRKQQAWPDGSVARATSMRASEGRPLQERRGLAVRDVLAAAVFEVDDLELLIGRLSPLPPGVTDDERARAQATLASCPGTGGQSGHCALHLDDVLTRGIDALRDDIAERAAGAEDEQATTYGSFLHALEGLSLLVEHAADAAATAARDSRPGRAAELKMMEESCRRVAHAPPESFRDAVQLLWLILLGVQHGDSVGLVVPGRMDRSLARFYDHDIAHGRLARGEALLLVECLYILINAFTPDGLAVSVMVGGRDAEGADVTNDLSHLCLEALRRTRLVYPTVGVCWHAGTPPSLVELAIDLISEGSANPAFFGDETIQRGLCALGTPAGDACNYINSTCVEITPVGGSNVWVASPYYNTCGLLLEEIAGQAASATPVASFDALLDAYRDRLAAAVEFGVQAQNALREERRVRGGKPLQSVFTRDCIARGRDIDAGGALYNWVECSFVGLANLADSLLVLCEEVFGQGRMTLAEMEAVLECDFEGHEDIRQRFLHHYPKYGQDVPRVDAFVREMAVFAHEQCARHRMAPDGSAYVPGAFVWIMHEQLGRETGATPDGRKAGTPLADGAGPAQGREVRGPTAAVLSTTRWDHSPMIGGVAFNMKFNRSLLSGRESRRHLRELVLTYMERGGFETQINVVDAETLRRARERPEEYRDLVVRIGGYTDYFARLSPAMQDEVIRRTEYQHV